MATKNSPKVSFNIIASDDFPEIIAIARKNGAKFKGQQTANGMKSLDFTCETKTIAENIEKEINSEFLGMDDFTIET